MVVRKLSCPVVFCVYLVVLTIVATAQFKLDRTCVQQGLDTTCLSFYTCESMHLYTKLMMSNLLFGILVYALDVCTIVCKCMHACQECKHQIWIACILACMQIVSQGQLLWTCTCTKVWFPLWNKTQTPLNISYCKAKAYNLGCEWHILMLCHMLMSKQFTLFSGQARRKKTG